MHLLQNSVAGRGKSHTEPMCFFVVGPLEKNSFFYLLFGCPTANFGLLSREQSLLPNVNHCVLVFLTCRSPVAFP